MMYQCILTDYMFISQWVARCLSDVVHPGLTRQRLLFILASNVYVNLFFKAVHDHGHLRCFCTMQLTRDIWT